MQITDPEKFVDERKDGVVRKTSAGTNEKTM